MNLCEETCVVCGEVSAELICRACHALIGVKPCENTGGTRMDTWWDELDGEILDLLMAGRPMETAELAAKLGMSTDAVCSCVAMLATGGRVRILSVELQPDSRPDVRAA
jgi:hypothetical protein